MDELHVIMMSYCGSRGAVPSPVKTAGWSCARIPAGLEAELLYCICIVFVCVLLLCVR